MIVMKFGGTSVGNAARIQDAANIVAGEQTKQPIVVTSAMSQVTNKLVALADMAIHKASSDELTAGVAELRTLHFQAIDELGLENETAEELRKTIDTKLLRLTEILDSVSSLGELTPRGNDLITSFGERLSIHLVAAALTQAGVPATPIEARELIVTDDNFGNAQPLLEASSQRTHATLRPLLDQGITPVITGFMGATADGIISTLGRGGSDYSATIIGHCIEADEVWIWTDVDGVMTADPRYTTGAHTIAQLSYDEAAELSYFGAKVLHPRTMVPAALSSIPIFIKNTMNPSATGTKITDKTTAHPDGAKALTMLKDLSLITVQGKGMQGMLGIAAKVFGTLAQENVNVLFISQASSENNLSLVTSGSDGEKAVEALKIALSLELDSKNLETVSQEPNMAMVAVVGEGMKNHTGVAGRIFSAIGAADLNVIAIAQGSSERNISFVVSAEQAQAAIQSIHDEFHLNNGKD